MRLSIDSQRCNGCSRCLEECPVGALTRGTPPHVAAESCIGCGHCGAVCSREAIESDAGPFVAIARPAISPDDWTAALASRRSVRHYRKETVDRATLEAILASATFAPTASNARDVEAVVLAGNELRSFATAVNGFYRRLLHLVERRWLRPLLWFTPLRPYLRQPETIGQLRTVVEGFDAGRDWLFYHAPVAVVLTAPRRNRLFGQVNAVIAAERMLTRAWGSGVGSCWIGYAEVALAHDRRLTSLLGLPKDRVARVVFTLGHPTHTYQRLPARAPLPVSWLGV